VGAFDLAEIEAALARKPDRVVLDSRYRDYILAAAGGAGRRGACS
jgi:hypothetical protein